MDPSLIRAAMDVEARLKAWVWLRMRSEIDTETDVKKVNHRDGCAVEDIGSLRCRCRRRSDKIKIIFIYGMRRDFFELQVQDPVRVCSDITPD